MTSTALLPVLALILYGLVWLALRAKRLQAERDAVSWTDLLARLSPVGRVGIEEVAAVFLLPSSEQLDSRSIESRLELRDIWDFIGGIEGLKAMQRNADVLIELACYVQRWNPEASVVAEQLRLDANQIKTSLAKIRSSQRRGTLSTWFPIHATRATAAYYLMTQRLCALYAISHEGLLAQLKAAI
jgi:hypothetical protein